MTAVWCEEEGCWDLELQRLWKGQGWWCLHPQVSSMVWFLWCFCIWSGLKSTKDLLWTYGSIDHIQSIISLPYAFGLGSAVDLSTCFSSISWRVNAQNQGQMWVLVCKTLWSAIVFTHQVVSKIISWLDNFLLCAARQVQSLCEVPSAVWGSRLKVRMSSLSGPRKY
jgi:hypothetical protein